MTEPGGRTPHASEPAEGPDDPRPNEDQERPHSTDPAEGVDPVSEPDPDVH